MPSVNLRTYLTLVKAAYLTGHADYRRANQRLGMEPVDPSEQADGHVDGP